MPPSTVPISPLPPLGFIAVECFFTRPPGDPWNEKTWPFPLIREMARGSNASQLVTSERYDEAFIDRFVEAGMKLAEQVCVGIITSCGFLANAQRRKSSIATNNEEDVPDKPNSLAARLPIPIATSSLIQIPALFAILPSSKSIGILTFDASQLTLAHLEQLGVSMDLHDRIHIAGAPAEGKLQRLVWYGDEYNHAAIEDELIREAEKLVNQHPSIGALVLECPQMPPFAEKIQNALGEIPVYDVSPWDHGFIKVS